MEAAVITVLLGGFPLLDNGEPIHFDLDSGHRLRQSLCQAFNLFCPNIVYFKYFNMVFNHNVYFCPNFNSFCSYKLNCGYEYTTLKDGGS